ncbi:MAG: hypothetical protein ACLGGX_04495 [Bdellovibrionia bacterium]
MKWFWFIVLIFLSTNVQARVFNLTQEKFASYLILGGGPSGTGKTFFEGETASSLEYSKGYSLDTSGEFGFMWASQYLNLRLGLEFISPAVLKGVEATSGTTVLYEIESKISGYVPKVGVEFNLQSTPRTRSFAFFNYGSGSITVDNTYDLTADGLAAFPGVVDHVLKMKGSAQHLSGGLGFEGFFSDTTTYIFEIGYRAMNFDKLTATETVTTFSNQVYDSGDVVKFANGDNRVLNMSGYFLNLGIRIYLW